jgi:hypothetical protein
MLDDDSVDGYLGLGIALEMVLRKLQRRRHAPS